MKDLYEILGVSKDADQKAIKSAYKKKSMESHPDKGGTEELMSELANAYAVLSDPEKRKRYDETGDYKQSANPERDMAINLVQGVAVKMMNDTGFMGERTNLIHEVTKHATNRMSSLSRSLKDVIDRQDQLQSMLDKIKAEETSPFIIGLSAMMNDLVILKTNMMQEKELVEKALVLMSDAEWIETRFIEQQSIWAY